MQAAIKTKYGITPTLSEASGGVFFVDVDAKRVWDNQVTYRFPEDAEVFAEIDKLKT